MTVCPTPFEGPEKKLELILVSPDKGIRRNRRDRWERVVRSSRAAIVSQISNDRIDAYLLSESSLFVWDDRVLMITCGRTTLVKAVPEILDIVGVENVALVFYERKNPLFPDAQQADFDADVAELGQYFSGKSYRLGSTRADHVHVFYASPAANASGDDATLQLLMNELAPMSLETFSVENGGTAVQAAVLSRLNGLYGGMAVDSHFFYPCGYSLNGILADRYYTIHVTPQPDGSYASFETNVIEVDYTRVIREIIGVFKPGRFSVVLTASMDAHGRAPDQGLPARLSGYAVTERSRDRLDCGYTVAFLNQAKLDERRPAGGVMAGI